MLLWSGALELTMENQLFHAVGEAEFALNVY